MKPDAALKRYFGYDGFRPGQKKIVEAIMEGRDALAIMPTGAGKSLCFQIPALMMDGMTLVVSPLISLMQDQVGQLVQSGVAAAYINSSLSPAQLAKVMERARDGAYKIIYVAPERLETFDFLQFARRAGISLVAIDEAHCVSHWGQDFRPSYLGISAFVQGLPARPVLSAFTATATPFVKDDIVRLLGLSAPFELTTGFNRKNLYFEVRRPKSKQAELEAYLLGSKGKSGIVYCSTRKAVEEVADKLKKRGIKSEKYHAGMTQDERAKAQQNFIHDRTAVIVATNAFGMGIDKSNVSYVVHFNMPKSIESYYQEAGRAGRDGSPAECLLFFSYQDVRINKFLIEQTDAETSLSPAEIEEVKARDYKRLREMEDYCGTLYCLRSHILDYFGDTGDRECGNCGNCQSGSEKVDATVDAQKILSCLVRMKELYGVSHLVSVLQGQATDKVRARGHDRLTTFGAMSGASQDKIRHILRYLMQQGYVRTAGERYPVLEVGQKAWDILKGGATVSIPELREKAPAKKAPENEGLFAELKKLRQEISQAEGVPAYVIFSDSTLRDICRRLPKDEREFLEVSGVGDVKLRKYGERFLAALARHAGAGSEHAAEKEREWKNFVETLEISDEPVHLTEFVKSLNALAEPALNCKISRLKVSNMLLAEGFLEESAGDKKMRLATKKGRAAGIAVRQIKRPTGEAYPQNFYDKDAQALLLDIVKRAHGF